MVVYDVINLISSSSPSRASTSSNTHSHFNSHSFTTNNNFLSSPLPIDPHHRSIPRSIVSISSSEESFTRDELELSNSREQFRKNWISAAAAIITEQQKEESNISISNSNRRDSYSDIFGGAGASFGKRRASDSFTITPIEPVQSVKTSAQRPQSQLSFKNKLEAIGSIRLHMSSSMAEAYEQELKRRFSDRQMHNCITEEQDERVPSDQGSFRWKFAGRPEFLKQRLFVLDSEAIWDDFVITQKFGDLLRAYDEPGVFLYFMNWRRAGQRHTTQLNRQFRQAINQDAPIDQSSRILPVADLENGLFLEAARLRLQVNFDTANTAQLSLVHLMDFLIEMTRVIATDSMKSERDGSEIVSRGELNITVSREIKVKSGKDAVDCWNKILCKIPRVTTQVADAIITRFPTFTALMEAYDALEDNSSSSNEDRRSGEMLSDILVEGTGKRIGSVVSNRIYKTLFCSQ